MRTHTNDLRTALRTFGRQIDGIITYQSIDNYYILTTEDEKYLATENLSDLATEKGPIIYDNEQINNIIPLFNTKLFKTVMKAIEIDCNLKIPSKTWLNAKFGVKVNESYEYIDFGNYYINKEPEYNASTKSYKHYAYDRMIESMIDYDDNPLNVNYPITYENYIKEICIKLGWNYDLTGLANADTLITEDLYLGNKMTYRDILDDICLASGGNFMFDNNEIFIVKYITETNEEVTEEDLKDLNVTISKKYGPINILKFVTADDVEIIAKQDDESISINGPTELKIKSSILMTSSLSDSFIDAMWSKISGIEFYLYDVSTIGMCIFEPFDRFTIVIDGNEYSTVMMNNEINISQGLYENCYIEEPEETTQEYNTSTPSDKEIKNAIIQVNKATGQIFLKVDNNGKIVTAELGVDPEKGSLFLINADTIDFTSYEFNLATTNLSIISDNVEITNEGIKLKNGAELIGSNGIITNFQYESYSIGFIYPSTFDRSDFFFLGYGTEFTGSNWANRLEINAFVPNNFVIKEAYITFYHYPVLWDNGGDYSVGGYCRNIKAYKVTNSNELQISGAFSSEYNIFDGQTLSEISGAFGASGYTAPDPDISGYELSSTTSIDIKDSLDTGDNFIVIKSSDAVPTYNANIGINGTAIGSKTGYAKAVLNIIGYYNYQE